MFLGLVLIYELIFMSQLDVAGIYKVFSATLSHSEGLKINFYGVLRCPL